MSHSLKNLTISLLLIAMTIMSAVIILNDMSLFKRNTTLQVYNASYWLYSGGQHIEQKDQRLYIAGVDDKDCERKVNRFLKDRRAERTSLTIVNILFMEEYTNSRQIFIP